MRNFLISGIPIESVRSLFALTDSELAEHKARRVVADARPGFPCRVSLKEAEAGETVILFPYTHNPVNGPYYSSGPVYVRQAAEQVRLRTNEVPEVVRLRLMSVRAYDANGSLVASNVVEGSEIELEIDRLFADKTVVYLHLHNAKPGCFSCRVDRA